MTQDGRRKRPRALGGEANYCRKVCTLQPFLFLIRFVPWLSVGHPPCKTAAHSLPCHQCPWVPLRFYLVLPIHIVRRDQIDFATRFHWGDDAKQYVDEVTRTRLEAEKPSNHGGRRRSVAAAEIMRARTYVLQGERTYVHAGHLAGSTGVVMAWRQRHPPHLLPSLLCAALKLRLVGVINLKRQGERSGRREQRDRETR